MDYEAQYKMTTDYVEETFRQNLDILEIYHVCVPFKVVYLCIHVPTVLASLG